LGYEKGEPAGRSSGDSRGGYSSKTVIGDDGAIEIAVPRDGNGNCGPQIGANGETRLNGFDESHHQSPHPHPCRRQNRPTPCAVQQMHNRIEARYTLSASGFPGSEMNRLRNSIFSDPESPCTYRCEKPGLKR
jgi:hypothetical protein